MSTTLLVLVVVLAIVVVLVVVGEQTYARYPEYFSLELPDAAGSQLQRRMKMAQIGAFVAMDAASDLIYPDNNRDNLLKYKKNKRSVDVAATTLGSFSDRRSGRG